LTGAAAGFALRRTDFRTVFFFDFALKRGRFRLAMVNSYR
jgi:hypothetical protein